MGTATLAFSRASKEAGRPGILTSDDWQELFKTVSPLAEWEGKFASWREEVATFRNVEEQAFFASRNDVLLNHVHRGWLCSLISEGEMLAVELLQQDPEANEQMKFLNLCLENLQSTLQTWHFAQQIESIAAVKN